MNNIAPVLKKQALILASAALVVSVLVGFSLRNVSRVEAAPGVNADYFLKIDGIDGESADAKHKNEIELTSYAWSKDNPGLVQAAPASSGSGGGAGKVQLHDISFKETISKASPQLMQAVASGKHFKEATLLVRKAGKDQTQFMTIKLSDIMISSYRTTGDNSGLPVDEFSLNFAKIEFSYSPQKADGSLDTPVVGAWDFQSNKSL